ncbi:Serine/threonine-protein kinase plk1 [Entomophthora muscae]|uniref:Serine/threonine-protein kinase plk1 n=1 Tax=Entomophthora muscae TaxID=34485 RepID=A0ACC2RU67_9FUNG|nr:Serine/threonine-protein kinase plk1 [Entomophthora muscae]
MAAKETKSHVKPSNKDWPALVDLLVDSKNKKAYRRGEFIGEGGFAKCYEVFDSSNGQRYCCKAIWKKAIKTENEKDKIRSEIRINSNLKHERIVTLHSCFEDDEFVYIILEICDKQSMMELLRRRKQLTEEEVRYYLLQIIDAMEYCLSKRVIHRDLKLGNVFIDSDMTIRVGDFGLATQLQGLDERKKTICGTPNYIAPEVLFDREGHSFEADMWSIGIIIYTLIIGIPPFQTNSTKKLYSKIRSGDYTFPPNKKISEEAKDLITKILTNDPDQRPKFADIRNHPFFTKGFTPTTLPQSALTSIPIFKTPNPLKAAPLPDEDEIVKKMDTIDVKDKSTSSKRRLESDRPTNTCAVSSEPATPPEEAPQPTPPKIKPAKQISLETLIFEEMVNTFERLFSHLKANRPIDTIRQELSSIPLETPNFISKWVDHGDQYGLGFELLDSTVGIFFRDSTSMVMAPDMYHLEYLYYPPNDENNGIKCEFLLSNSLPSPLHKKQRVLKRYSRYMTDRLSSAVAAPFRASVLPPHLLNPPPYAVPANKAMAQLPYITKFLRTRRASLFRLSSRVVQVSNA